jgi:hypothetical protein
MDKILIASLALLIVVGCAHTPSGKADEPAAPPPTPGQATSIPSPEPTASAPQTPLTPSPTQAENTYTNAQFGFTFNYPDGYVITSQEANPTGGYVTILRQEDVGTPEPLLIYINVRENPEQLPLGTFLDQEIKPLIQAQYPNTTVAGQPALDFESTGLYEMRNLLFSTPDGRYLVHLNATYLGSPSEDDPLWQVAKGIAESFQWQR